MLACLEGIRLTRRICASAASPTSHMWICFGLKEMARLMDLSRRSQILNREWNLLCQANLQKEPSSGTALGAQAAQNRMPSTSRSLSMATQPAGGPNTIPADLIPRARHPESFRSDLKLPTASTMQRSGSGTSQGLSVLALAMDIQRKHLQPEPGQQLARPSNASREPGMSQPQGGGPQPTLASAVPEAVPTHTAQPTENARKQAQLIPSLKQAAESIGPSVHVPPAAELQELLRQVTEASQSLKIPMQAHGSRKRQCLSLSGGICDQVDKAQKQMESMGTLTAAPAMPLPAPVSINAATGWPAPVAMASRPMLGMTSSVPNTVAAAIVNAIPAVAIPAPAVAINNGLTMAEGGAVAASALSKPANGHSDMQLGPGFSNQQSMGHEEGLFGDYEAAEQGMRQAGSPRIYDGPPLHAGTSPFGGAQTRGGTSESEGGGTAQEDRAVLPKADSLVTAASSKGTPTERSSGKRSRSGSLQPTERRSGRTPRPRKDFSLL